jgi:hypothetical protein
MCFIDHVRACGKPHVRHDLFPTIVATTPHYGVALAYI